MDGNKDPSVQLKEALVKLQADPLDRFIWLDEIAQAVVELGGGDAVDLLMMKLDDTLAAHEAGDPTEN